ncbi:MAG: serine hydrolase [Maribacter sp.]
MKTIQAQLDKIIEDKMVMGVSAGYSINGETIEQASAGYADKKAEKKFKLDTKLLMGSIPKTMTALAVMQLVEQEKIDSVIKANDIPVISIRIINNGELISSKGFGFHNRNSSKAANENSIYQIASDTKKITGILTLKNKKDESNTKFYDGI